MKKIFTASLMFLLIFFISIQVHADKIRIKTVDGVEVVENPKAPAPPKGTLSKIILTQELSIGEGTYDEDMFAELTAVDVDGDGNIYILDRKDKKVKIFDNAGKFVKKFGRDGQGPGEMSVPITIQVTPHGELVVSDALTGKLMYFTLEGEFLREISAIIKTIRGFSLPLVDSQGDMIGQQIVLSEDKVMREVRKYDSELNTLFTITSIDNTSLVQGKINPFQVVIFYQVGKDDTIYYSNPETYEIRVLNSEGKLVRKIMKDYEPVKVTDEDKEDFFERLGEVPAPVKDRVEFPKEYPPYVNFTIDEEWRLFVITYEKGKEDREFFFDVFDVEGRYIAKFPFKGDARVWKGQKLYAIEEDDDGYQMLRIYSVRWE